MFNGAGGTRTTYAIGSALPYQDFPAVTNLTVAWLLPVKHAASESDCVHFEGECWNLQRVRNRTTRVAVRFLCCTLPALTVAQRRAAEILCGHVVYKRSYSTTVTSVVTL